MRWMPIFPRYDRPTDRSREGAAEAIMSAAAVRVRLCPSVRPSDQQGVRAREVINAPNGLSAETVALLPGPLLLLGVKR